MSWRQTVEYVVRAATDWFFRRGPERWIFGGAVSVLAGLNATNWYVKFHSSIGNGAGSVEIGTGAGLPGTLYWVVTLVCLVLMICSVAWARKRYSDEMRRLSKKRVLIVEARGLRDDAGAPLDAAIPPSIEGHRTLYVLDVRQHKDGAIVEPEDLLQPVYTAKSWLHQMQRSSDRGETSIVYGGLAAVPVTFLTGVLFDDEGPVTVMDWDRGDARWRALDGADDGLRFEVSGLDSVQAGGDVALAVSASYHVKAEDLASTFNHPVVRMTLPTTASSHWSQPKQAALADQFLDTLKRLDALGARQIHLVLAAQNSLVFNLGRRYDKRNLPRIAVYQFERSQPRRYPWAIQMPAGGVATAGVLKAAP